MEMKMGTSFSFFFLFFFLCQLSVSSTSIQDFLPSDPIFGSTGLAAFRQQSGCSGHGCGVAAVEDAEFQLDSEINRRLLGDGTKSGYGALVPNRPICNTPDGKRYNCLPSPNPDSGKRGCTHYYRCPVPPG